MTTCDLPQKLLTVLTQVQAFTQSRGVACYLVGGVLRDQLLGRPLRYLNVDLAVPTGALTLASQLAAELEGACVPLDEVAGTARIVVGGGGERIELDVSDFRGATLDEDLRRRDFTINAMAISLDAWLRNPAHPAPLIDPLGGQTALTQRTLVACFAGTFEDDPVRILRAFRFLAALDLTGDPGLVPLMGPAVPALARVSGERVREELLAICDTPRAAVAFHSLNALGALDVLFPELQAGRGMAQGPVHHLDVLGHQLETVVQADRFLADFAEFAPPLREPLTVYCAEALVERHSRKSLIKLAGLLHDVGKPATRSVEADGEIWFYGHEHTGAALTQGIIERLRLSNREATMVCQLVRHHLRPGFLSREAVLTRRAIYRFFKELGDDGPACLLMWWADRMATRGTRSRLDQIDQQRARLEELLHAYFFQAEEVVKPPRLLDGHGLMRTLHLPQGPLIGTLLGIIEEAQAEGQLHTPEDALACARRYLEQHDAS